MRITSLLPEGASQNGEPQGQQAADFWQEDFW
jgi:hypothetical protein